MGKDTSIDFDYTEEEVERLLDSPEGLQVPWEVAEALGAIHENPEQYESAEETAARLKRESEMEIFD